MDTAHTSPHPLRDGNRFQRAYYRWAQPHYERIGRDDPALREQVEEADRLLYTRQGAGIWIGWLCAVVALSVGLKSAGLVWAAAIPAALFACAFLGLLVIAAWLRPSKTWVAAKPRRLMIAIAVAVPLGGMFGFAAGHWERTGRLDPAELAARFIAKADVLALALGGTAAGMLLLFWVVVQASRQAQERRLARALLLAERDAARAAAAEAELRLLQAQIHPHFVFNTLATLQHWVDKKDERAGPLLRELSGFLRRSTEMLGRPTVPLAEEAQAVAHYLAILQARQGERLGFVVEIEPRTAAQTLPPGLLLTLVENAVEHGLEPKIGGGRVHVTSGCEGRGWWLRVDDDGLGLAPGAADNVGLSNLRQRLRQHFKGQAGFTLSALPAGGTRAEIRFEETPCPAS